MTLGRGLLKFTRLEGQGQGVKRGKDNEDEDMEGDFQYGQTSRP